MTALKIYKDANRVTSEYASRNFRDLCPDSGHAEGDKSSLDFKIKLRQRRKPASNPSSPSGRPILHEPRKKPLPEAPIWYYNDPVFSDIRYGNVEVVQGSLKHPVRYTPSSALMWTLGLRNSPHAISQVKEMPGRSWEGTKSRSRSATPNPCPDRLATCLPIAHHRESVEYECCRYPGCEGSSASQWSHLITPGKARDTLAWETTLRGASDVRTNEVILGMMGKKPLHFKPPRDSICESDPKLRYIG